MLIFHKPAPPRPPKRRSRAGCIFCKQKKKKCNEMRPQCDRCEERNLKCEYEAVRPRRRRRQSSVLSLEDGSPRFQNDDWSSQTDRGRERTHSFPNQGLDWDTTPPYTFANSERFGDTIEEEDEEEEEEEVEQIVRPGSISSVSGTMVRSRSQYPDLAMIAPSPVGSPLLEFSAPVFMEFTERRNRRALVDHFCNVLSHLIVFKEDTGNPFQQLVLPLSHASSPVLDAIFALSSAHLENRGIETEEKSLFFHNKALQGLAKLIDQRESACREEVLGAIMLLVYYEVLVQRGSSNMVRSHLKGCMTVMRSQPQSPSPTSMFLERAFRFYDVIAALSYDTAPISPNPSPMTPLNLPSTPSPSPLNSVDSLLGMATDLWPIIHRLSHLRDSRRELHAAEASGNTSKAVVLRTELESTSQAIELALTNWTPSIAWPEQAGSPESPTDTDSPISPTSDPRPNPTSTLELPPSPPVPGPFLESSSPDPFASSKPVSESDNDVGATSSSLNSILHNANAYRHAALIFLYRDIRLLPRSHPLIQTQVRLTLLACLRVVQYAGPMSALLWPLFMGSVEATESEDRDMARKVFGGVERRQGMRNIKGAWEVVEEVWRRGDGGNAVEWREVSREMGVGIVFG